MVPPCYQEMAYISSKQWGVMEIYCCGVLWLSQRCRAHLSWYCDTGGKILSGRFQHRGRCQIYTHTVCTHTHTYACKHICMHACIWVQRHGGIIHTQLVCSSTHTHTVSLAHIHSNKHLHRCPHSCTSTTTEIPYFKTHAVWYTQAAILKLCTHVHT